jgi:hypothetical protein
MEFFAYKVQFIEETDIPTKNKVIGVPPRTNFNTVIDALTVIMIVTIGDDWNNIMYDHYRAILQTQDKAMASLTIIFFVILFIFMNWILMNLFLAILLDSYGNKPADADMMLEDMADEKMDEIGPLYACMTTCSFKLRNCCERKCPCLKKKNEENESEDNESSQEEIEYIANSPSKCKTEVVDIERLRILSTSQPEK